MSSVTLSPGSIAPNFEAHGPSGPIRFHQWTGDSWSIIFSHPAGNLFQNELTDVSRRFPEIEKRGVKVIGFSRNWLDDNRYWNSVNQKYGRQVGYMDKNVQILADDGGQLSALYGMVPSNNNGGTQNPNTVFLIDPKKVIRMVLAYPSSISTRLYQLLRTTDDAIPFTSTGLEEINTATFGLNPSGQGQIYAPPPKEKSSKLKSASESTFNLLSSAESAIQTFTSSDSSSGGGDSTDTTATSLATTATNYIENALHLASTLSELGQAMPFVAPAFVLLKTIIAVEQRARDVDAKCTDLVQRITFLLSHLPALKRLKHIEDSTRQVIDRVNVILKESASFIEVYRKQGVVARRLKVGNKDRFESLARKVKGCTKDLVVSLQISQTVLMEGIISRGVPNDPGDLSAEQFLRNHGGEENVMGNEELVRMFAEEMKVHVDDVGSVMKDLNINILDAMKSSQEKLEKSLNESISASVIAGFKSLSEELNEKEKEQVFHCVQCDKDYRLSTSGEKSCGYHKAEYDSWKRSFPCCTGDKNAPCEAGTHRAEHHCDYPYASFFPFARGITGYVDTRETWTEVEDPNLRTNADSDTQKASIGRLLRWKSRGAIPDLPTILIQVGNVGFRNRYFFGTFNTKELEVRSKVVEITHQMIIFRTSSSPDEFSMAEWVLSPGDGGGGMITGIKLTAKSSTSSTPEIRFCPVDITTLDTPPPDSILTLSRGGFRSYKPSTPYTLPPTQRVSGELPEKPCREVRKDFKPRTSSSDSELNGLLVKATDDPPLVANPEYASVEEDYFVGSISLFNKHSQIPISIASIKASYRLIGDSVYLPAKKLEILPQGETGGGAMPLTIDPRQTQILKLHITVPRSEEDTKFNIRWWNRAFIARRKPLRLKLTFVDIDDEDSEVSLVVDYVCPVYPPTKPSPPSEDKEPLGFFYVDDLDLWERHSVEVQKVVNYTGMGIKIGNWELDSKKLKSLVFLAIESGESEVDMGIGEEKNADEPFNAWSWKSFALIDLNCRRVYAFKILITKPSARAGKGIGCIGYAPCPAYDDIPEDEIESMEVRYAQEKVGMPEMEAWVEEEVGWDDEVDDVVPEEPKPKSKTSESGTSTTTGSVVATGAGTGVGAGIGGQVVLPEALEQRLASIDGNLGRLANAIEQLVEIMKAKAK